MSPAVPAQGCWRGSTKPVQPTRRTSARRLTCAPSKPSCGMRSRARCGRCLKHRAALILRDIEGLSTTDAVSVLGLSEAAFKSRLHRARLAVRRAIEEQLGDGDDSAT